MKVFLLHSLFFLFLSFQVNAQEWKLIAREPESITQNVKIFSKNQKKAAKNKIIKELNNLNHLSLLIEGKYSASEFINIIINTNSYNDELTKCLLVHVEVSTCQQLILKNLVLLLRASKVIDDVASLILLAHVNNNKKQLQWLNHKQIDLPSYLSTLNQVERSYLKNQSEILPTILSHRSFRQKVSVWGNITPRQQLYLSYSFIEIKFMAQTLLKAQNAMLAHSVFLSYDNDGDGVIDEQIKIPDPRKHDRAVEVLDDIINKESTSQGILTNQHISKAHLMMAASELGLVSELMVEELLNLPSFKMPKSGKSEMYIRALWAVGKTALVLIPGGVYFILPIIIVEIVVENHLKKKENKPRVN